MVFKCYVQIINILAPFTRHLISKLPDSCSSVSSVYNYTVSGCYIDQDTTTTLWDYGVSFCGCPSGNSDVDKGLCIIHPWPISYSWCWCNVTRDRCLCLLRAVFDRCSYRVISVLWCLKRCDKDVFFLNKPILAQNV